ncbi:type VI immunity family protein [Cronobacter malonaticus]|uniref:type VI immunity family protein n=2 Tax=Cronobacter malonaticus TaxID=413503 RepID=UPI000CFCC3DE|nr:type VI immunity family protein [Cronobacter malonaticus]
MDFFEKFKQAEYDLTYGAEDDPEHHNALQVGLVAWFYLDKGYTKENRARIAEAWQLYHNEFGEKLAWGYTNDPNKARGYRTISPKDMKINIANSYGDICHFYWGSNKGFRYVSDYLIECGSNAGWFENIHRSVTFFGFYLPVSQLKEKVYLERLLFQFCNILHPMHGFMGLGIQQCQEKERYQHLEYEIGQEFLGVDITNSKTDKHSREGIRSVNWHTFFNNDWLNKLGGIQYLRSALGNSSIEIIPYDAGVIIRAGEWPELGWVKDNPYPELYVKVNKVLKPIRAPELDSMGYGSIAGEIRFDRNSTARWLARFDVDLPPLATMPAAKDPVRISCWTDDIAPYAGQWATIVNGTTDYIQTREGQKMPYFEDKHGNKHRALWQLLKRDDKGSVFIMPE